MAEIPLTGLIGSHPLGAMSAFGLLRVVSQVPEFYCPRLRWHLREDWTAALHTDNCVDAKKFREQLLAALVARQRTRAAADYLTWGDDIKVEPTVLAQLLNEKTNELTFGERDSVSFWAVLGSEMARQNNGKVKPTAFHMTAGQQKFLKAVRELAVSLNPSRTPGRQETAEQIEAEIRQAFARALFDPWSRQDQLHSLGWDPATEALHALSDMAPTDAGATCERAAVWLAFESLPLFPCAPSGRRLVTRGFDEDSDYFSWPIWESPITVGTLSSLLGLAELAAPKPDIGELAHRGVVAVYRSVCQRDANGRGTFRHAILAAGGGPKRQIVPAAGSS